jgi:hypothetical protein
MGLLGFLVCLFVCSVFGRLPSRLGAESCEWSFHRRESSFGFDRVLNIMPLPRNISWPSSRPHILVSGELRLTSTVFENMGSRQMRAVARLKSRWEKVVKDCSNFVPFSDEATFEGSVGVPLSVSVLSDQAIDIPRQGHDESYALEVNTNGDVNLRANTSTGVLRGFAVLLQLLARRESKLYFPTNLTIQDRPARVWRGMMVDVARHYLPLSLLGDVLDGMELARLNVLHLHLSDDQGFRFEMRGRNGTAWNKLRSVEFYTRDELQTLVSDASDRGIRVFCVVFFLFFCLDFLFWRLCPSLMCQVTWERSCWRCRN